MGKRTRSHRPQVRTFEEYALRILQREHKECVELNVDNSLPGMYDLRSGSEEPPRIAVECIGAVDPIRTATWNVGPARGPLQIDASFGDWLLEIRPDASIRDLKKDLREILRACFQAG